MWSEQCNKSGLLEEQLEGRHRLRNHVPSGLQQSCCASPKAPLLQKIKNSDTPQPVRLSHYQYHTMGRSGRSNEACYAHQQ